MDVWFLRGTGHGSQVDDIRYVWARGDRVRIIAGPHAGMTGILDCRMPPQPPAVMAPGYRVKLDSSKLVTVGWEEVKRVNPTPSP